jgi:pilus assembly protein CpaB
VRISRAQLIVLVVALGAAAMAVKLVKTNTPAAPPAPVPAPVQVAMVDVLVASKDIGIGQTLSGQNIAWQAWPANNATSAELITKSKQAGAIAELTGARSRTGFTTGEPIRAASLVKAGSGFLSGILAKGMRGVAIEISPENGAGGFILPGDHVDVILTRTPVPGKNDTSSSDTILYNVHVLAIDHAIDQGQGQNTAAGKVATLEVTPEQAKALTLARRLGTISLVLRSIDDYGGPTAGDASRIGNRSGINVVRYGITTSALR